MSTSRFQTSSPIAALWETLNWCFDLSTLHLTLHRSKSHIKSIGSDGSPTLRKTVKLRYSQLWHGLTLLLSLLFC
jgi:hypothetical protein